MTATYAEKGKTNVQITTETRDRLVALGRMNDSYEDVIKGLLDRQAGEDAWVEQKMQQASEEQWIRTMQYHLDKGEDRLTSAP